MLNQLPKYYQEFPWSNIVPLCKEVDITDKEIIVHLKFPYTVIATTYLHIWPHHTVKWALIYSEKRFRQVTTASCYCPSEVLTEKSFNLC